MSEAVAVEKVPCPNPVCDGFVAGDQKQCGVCGDILGPCPNCGALLSKRIGSCGRCGYSQVTTESKPPGSVSAADVTTTTVPAESAMVPVVITFNISRPAVAHMLANAYRNVALADGDMRRATNVLEQLRGSLLTESDALKTWRALNDEIGDADPATLRPALIDLRTSFREQLFDQEKNRFSSLFGSNPDAGWSEWVRTFAEALAYWRLAVCEHLTGLPLPFPKDFYEPNDFRKVLRLLLHERWTEVQRFFLFLGEQGYLHGQTRARLLITAAQIHLYYFPRPERALELLQRADFLSPNTGRVKAALGDYFTRTNDLEKARTYIDQSLAMSPDEVEGYIYMGDLLDRQGNLDEAIEWYRKAITNVGGDSLGYTRLFRAYGRPEMFDKYESQILPLSQHAIAVEEMGQYRIYLDLGDAYLSAKRFDQAQANYQEAINLDPDRLDGYTWKGFGYIEEGETKYEQARQAFAEAIRVAPEAHDGYWGMGQLCEREAKSAEAITLYQQVALKRPELRPSMLGRIGTIQSASGEYQASEATFLEAIKADNKEAVFYSYLAETYIGMRRWTEAREQLQKALDLDRDELTYKRKVAQTHNEEGTALFGESQFEQAAECFLLASKSDDTEPVYFSNLAETYARLQRWADAREQLQKAFQLDTNDAEYKRKTALCYNEEGNLFYSQKEYERALTYYSESVELNPEVARYYSNRALARERLAVTSPDPASLLQQAVADAQTALDSARSANEAAQVEEFSRLVERIEREIGFLKIYGPIVLSSSLREDPLVVAVGSEVDDIILNSEKSELSTDFLDKISELRGRIQKEQGLLIPPLTFTPREVIDPSANYELRLNGEQVSLAKLELTNQDGQEQLTQRIELDLMPHLDRLCGHQETANLLRQDSNDENAEILTNPARLHRLTLKLKELLNKGEAIDNLAQIREQTNQAFPDGNSSTAAPPDAQKESLPAGLTSLSLSVSDASKLPQPDLSEALVGIQALAFNIFGVTIPQASILIDKSLGPNDFAMQFNGEKIGPVPGIAPGELWIQTPVESILDSFPKAKKLDYLDQQGSVISEAEAAQSEVRDKYVSLDALNFLTFCFATEIRLRIDLFLTTALAEHYLSRLNEGYPDLIAVTRFFFTTEQLTRNLRALAKAQVSIKNLPVVLESLLSNV